MAVRPTKDSVVTMPLTGIDTRLLIAGSSGGGNQAYSTTLVLFSVYTLEILGRGNQPQGWEIPLLPTL